VVRSRETKDYQRESRLLQTIDVEGVALTGTSMDRNTRNAREPPSDGGDLPSWPKMLEQLGLDRLSAGSSRRIVADPRGKQLEKKRTLSEQIVAPKPSPSLQR
jgi:hypothetical protein